MKTFVPDYYNDFKCLAGDCKHSCCIGWEIDIDADTLEYYNSVEGDFGKRLQNNISYNEDTAFFAMDSCGRCPFLNEKGLCDIMLNLGFDKVSQICDDHPRFRNFYSDRTEIGLGMSCEAVAVQILSKQDKMQLVCIDGDEELLWPEEEDFLDFRADVFDILQNRHMSVQDRIEKMLDYCNIESMNLTAQKQAQLFLSLERLDPVRDTLLAELSQATEKDLYMQDSKLETAFEQLAVYLAFRHLTESLDDDRLVGRVQFVAQFYALIRNLCRIHYNKTGNLSLEDMAELCRIFSAEIEYSPDNMDTLFDTFS
ncbi:MAG: flagellin lysine-N-methylase [Oscillospiraceae bacterium]|nr:flagellin lysine-N-methylase [Oscillospiraceae bacterium]